MVKYTEAKSNFVKEKIKNSSWKDRDYIEDLMFIEKSITEGIGGWAGNMKLHGLKSRYKKEYHKIFEELDPKGYKKYLKEKTKEEEQEKKEMKEFEKQEKEEEEEEKEDWVKAGGRV